MGPANLREQAPPHTALFLSSKAPKDSTTSGIHLRVKHLFPLQHTCTHTHTHTPPSVGTCQTFYIFLFISLALHFLYFNVSLLFFNLLNTIDLFTLEIHLFALQIFIDCQANDIDQKYNIGEFWSE